MPRLEEIHYYLMGVMVFNVMVHGVAVIALEVAPLGVALILKGATVLHLGTFTRFCLNGRSRAATILMLALA